MGVGYFFKTLAIVVLTLAIKKHLETVYRETMARYRREAMRTSMSDCLSAFDQLSIVRTTFLFHR